MKAAGGEESKMSIFYIHMSLLVLMCILVVSALIVAKKRGEGWFPKHRILAILGVTSGIIGFGFMFYNKISHGWPHFSTLHAIGGGIALLFLLDTPVLGLLVTRGKDSLRPVHRILGRITALLALLVLVTGAFKLLEHLGLMKD